MSSYNGIFGGGMRRGPWGITEDSSRMAVEAPQAGPQKQGGGFKHVIGILGDALLGAAGKEGFYGPLLAHRKSRDQDFARQQQLMQQKRAAGLEDYEAKKRIDLNYPTPTQPPAIARETEWLNSLPPEERVKAIAAIDVLRPIMATTWQGPQHVPRGGTRQPQVIGAELPPGWTIQGN